MTDPVTEDELSKETQHIWTALVVNVCNTAHPRELNFAASYEFDKAVAVAKELIAKKWPNRFESCPDAPWHPDYELVGIRRGMELDKPEEEPT
jgi:hypothetical protein